MTQFRNVKLRRGEQAVSSEEINRVFDAYRRVAHRFCGGQDGDPTLHPDVDDCEKRICVALKLPRVIPIRAAHFADCLPAADGRTASLAKHDFASLRRFAREQIDLVNDAVPARAGTFAALMNALRATPVSGRPACASLAGFRVLEDSITFDNSDWEPVYSEQLSVPRQPTYCTRVLRLDPRDPNAKTVTLEYNTSGFGVLPLIGLGEQARTFFDAKTSMAEAADAAMRTTYVQYDVAEACRRNRPFEIVSRVVFFNGVQDQVLRQAPDGRPMAYDWHGKRVVPGSEEADMTVILPDAHGCESSQFVRRPESLDRDVVEQPGVQGRLFEPASVRAGSALGGPKAIWKLPTRDVGRTIFSFRWSWQEKFQGRFAR